MNYHFQPYLSGDQVETLNKEIDNCKPKELNFYLQTFKNTRLFANARLASLLYKCLENNISITLRMGENLKEYTPNTSNKYWILFTTTPTGVLLVHYADRVIEPSGKNVKSIIREIQYSILKKSKNLLGYGKERAALAIEGFNTPEKADVFKYTSKGTYNLTKFYIEFSKLLYDINGFRNQSIVDVISGNVGLEALQNVNDHALTLNPEKGNQIQFLDVRRTNINAYRAKIENIIEKNDGPVTNYLNNLKEKWHTKPHDAFNELSLIEVSISDCGIGIPAKISGSTEIYFDKIKKEVEALEYALKPSSSTKIGEVGAGFGLPKIMNAIIRIDGLIIFRTGRLCMYKSCFENKINHESQLSFWDATERNYLPGTSISMLFPWSNSNVNQQSLFDE